MTFGEVMQIGLLKLLLDARVAHAMNRLGMDFITEASQAAGLKRKSPAERSVPPSSGSHTKAFPIDSGLLDIQSWL